jgi:hypothetical protein
MNVIHKFMVYADVDLLGEHISTISEQHKIY